MIKERISTYVKRSNEAFGIYSRISISARTKFLMSIVDSLNGIKDEIIEVATEETNLPGDLFLPLQTAGLPLWGHLQSKGF